MKPLPRPWRLVRGVLAVQAALAATGPAFADDDPQLYALTHAGNRVELGLAARSRFAAKAEEYSGFTGSSLQPMVDVALNGGPAFDSADADALRWRVDGERLGLASRSFDVAAGVQGLWRLQFGYDELQRNQSDSYQSPYQGVGTGVLTLPPGWKVPVVPRVNATAPNARGLSPAVTGSPAIVGGVLTPPTPAQLATSADVQASDLGAFQSVELFTRRSRVHLGGGVDLPGGWSVATSFTNEHREGLRPLGAQSRATNGDTSSILPVPVDDDDRRVNATLAWTAETLQLQAAVDASSYVNQVRSVTWDLWALPTRNATMATAPSNHWVNLSLSANWLPAPGTRVVADYGRGRSSQNEPLLKDATALLVPVSSAQALVIDEHASLKLLQQLGRDWRVSAEAKHVLRDNRTPVNLYGFYDNDNAPTGTSPFAALFPQLSGLGQNFNLNANLPYSRRVDSIELVADGRIAAGHRLKLGLEDQSTDRWCSGSWINCANADSAHEATLKADWLATITPELNTRLGLSAAHRRVHYDENAFLALVPMANQSPSTATGALAGSTAYATLVALGLNGYGPISGLNPAAAPGSAQAFYFPLNNVLDNLLYGNENRISELAGMRRYNQAERNRVQLHGSATWQATEAWTLQAGLDVSADNYPASRYGLQHLDSQALHLDATWAPDESTVVSLFGSLEARRTRVAGNTYTANSTATAVGGATAIDGGCFATIALRNANNKIDPCLDWQSTQRERTGTLGLSVTWARLAGGKLALTGTAVASRGRTDIDVIGGNYVNNPFAGVAGNATSAIAAFYVPAQALPTVRVDSAQLQLTGTWRLNKDAALRGTYGVLHLRSSDWATEGLQDGGLTQVLPTREQAPRHTVQSVGLSYLYFF
jgi:hypothetical protein